VPVEVVPAEPPGGGRHELLPTPVAAANRERRASAAAGLSSLAESFTVRAVDVPATHTVIQLTDGRGEVVGSIELMRQRNGVRLVVGEQEWEQPGGVFGAPDPKLHFGAVVDRLMAEAIALADRLGASVTTTLPGSLAPAERLRAYGFHQAGDMWVRDRAGSVVDAKPGSFTMTTTAESGS
jgi:hypothetical protein